MSSLIDPPAASGEDAQGEKQMSPTLTIDSSLQMFNTTWIPGESELKRADLVAHDTTRQGACLIQALVVAAACELGTPEADLLAEFRDAIQADSLPVNPMNQTTYVSSTRAVTEVRHAHHSCLNLTL